MSSQNPQTLTLTFNSTNLFLQSLPSATPTPPTTLYPIPSNFPPSKLIPKTRFLVDAFRHAGDYSYSYFLSHFHSDHYTGLTPNWSKGIIFCSQTTARLLVEVLKVPESSVVALPLKEPVLIDGSEVTLIDANHCPGAVQFLFKVPVNDGKKFERYVHTGDFRFCESMKLDDHLKEFVGCDVVFLDTTYCDPKFVFPSQEESVDYIVSVINKVRDECGSSSSPKSVLFLVATYVIGKERILLEIANRCRCKLYVDSRKIDILRVLGYGAGEVFTGDDTETDVHVVGWNILGETWPYFRPNYVNMKEIMVEQGYARVVGFVPTGWTYEVKRNKFAVRSKDSFEIHLVPYSEHSNYEELREFVKFLKPKRVIPTVGSDIENVDSKHVDRMRKHFVGLVDETANKRDFLMNFHRKSCGSDDGGEVFIPVPSEELLENESRASYELLQQGKGDNDSKNNTILKLDPKRSDVEELNTCMVPLATDKVSDEMLRELSDCLPSWVSQEQLLDLIESSGRNVVAAVSNFYERETEFHRQIFTSSSCSQPSISQVSFSTEVPAKDRGSENLNVSPAKGPKLLRTLQPSSKIVSPGKRKQSTDNSPKAKRKTNSKMKSNESGQSRITRFFTKTLPKNSESGGVGSNPPNDERLLSSSFEVEINKFIQIINGDDTLRSYAASILEKTKGDVNKALDLYYGNPEDKPVGEKDAAVSLHPDTKNECTSDPDQGKTLSEKLETVVPISVEQLLVQGSTSFISLPPEEYNPIEHACWRHGQPTPYLHLARTFELVEKEKGRIKSTSMFCNMFRSLLALSPEDVLSAVYLCTNKIAADHENVELNIGGGIVTAALEDACGVKRSRIKEMYNRLGDLGDVAQECRQTQTLLARPSPLLVKDVFSVLRKISLQIGNGSTARKKGLIVNLMRSCREMEMKFLVRTLVRNLRIGAMMRTILPAFAQAVVMNSFPNFQQGEGSEKFEKFQRLSAAAVEAYHILPNLDIVIPSILKEGVNFSSSTLSMTPGIPIRPMLAKITNGIPRVLKLFQNRAFTCEFKYDGQRAQIHTLADGSVRIFSRNGDDTTSRFPDVVAIINQLSKPSAVTFVLDAEVVAVDRKNSCKIMSFQELSSREKGSRESFVAIENIKVDICIFVFDIMFANGQQLLSLPLRERRKYLEELLGDSKQGYLEYAKEISIEAEEANSNNEATLTKMSSFLDDALCSSCEGIMVKSLDVDAGYLPSKRSDSWLKVKRDYVEGLGDTLDLVPIGAWHGNGRKAGWYSPFLVACYNPDTEEFQSLCRVMSGFSDLFYIEMKEFFSGDRLLVKKPAYYDTAETPDLWFSPEVVWEIRGADLTVSPVHQAAVGLVHPSRGISLRFPRFIRVVSDRNPEECSIAADIAEMFHSQSRKMDVPAGN